jgi:hypothetical protein
MMVAQIIAQLKWRQPFRCTLHRKTSKVTCGKSWAETLWRSHALAYTKTEAAVEEIDELGVRCAGSLRFSWQVGRGWASLGRGGVRRWMAAMQRRWCGVRCYWLFIFFRYQHFFIRLTSGALSTPTLQVILLSVSVSIRSKCQFSVDRKIPIKILWDFAIEIYHDFLKFQHKYRSFMLTTRTRGESCDVWWASSTTTLNVEDD